MTRKAVQEERKAQILEALNTCLSEKPFRETTIKDIAKTAGLQHGVLHYYFESKQDILLNFIDYKIEKYLSEEAEWFSVENLNSIPKSKVVEETLKFNRNLILNNKTDIKIIFELFSIANYDRTVREKLKEAAARIESIESDIIRRAGLDEGAASVISRSIFSLFVGLGLFSVVLDYDDGGITDIVETFRTLAAPAFDLISKSGKPR